MVKFNGEKLQDMIAFDIYKHFKDLVCKNMFLEGIQTENLSIIRLNAGDKKNFRHWGRKEAEHGFMFMFMFMLDLKILTGHSIF